MYHIRQRFCIVAWYPPPPDFTAALLLISLETLLLKQTNISNCPALGASVDQTLSPNIRLETLKKDEPLNGIFVWLIWEKYFKWIIKWRNLKFYLELVTKVNGELSICTKSSGGGGVSKVTLHFASNSIRRTWSDEITWNLTVQ